MPTGAALAAHPGVDKVAFTGSTEVGRKIMAAAAGSNLKRVSLELGGKSPNVIFADADLEQAIKGATWAVFSSSGQECVAGSRLFVEKPVFQQVVDGLAAQAQRIRVGPGFAPKVHIGPIVSEKQLQTVMGYIESGRQSGRANRGWRRAPGRRTSQWLLRPAHHLHPRRRLAAPGSRGNLRPGRRRHAFRKLGRAYSSRANDTRYGLAAGAWTRDVSKAHRFARAVNAGTVWINSYGLFDPAAPFGGYKESGFGREMGREALDLYTQTKTVWIGL